jgi:hypothetical protein
MEIIKKEVINVIKFREDLILEVGGDFEEGFITGFEIEEESIRVDVYEDGWGFYSKTLNFEGDYLD